MIPASSIISVCDDNHDVIPDKAVLYRMNERGHITISTDQVGIARMLIVRPYRLVKAHRWQGSVFDCAHHIPFVLQMDITPRSSLTILLEVNERLMVVH